MQLPNLAEISRPVTFTFHMYNTRFTVLIIPTSKKLFLTASDPNNNRIIITHLVSYDNNGNLIPGGYLVYELYQIINATVNTNGITAMWNYINDILSDIIKDEQNVYAYNVNEENNIVPDNNIDVTKLKDYLTKIVPSLATKDEKIDEGDKPFFISWRKNHESRKPSEKNLEKTARYFGKDTKKECETNKISSVWSEDSERSQLTINYFLDGTITK